MVLGICMGRLLRAAGTALLLAMTVPGLAAAQTASSGSSATGTQQAPSAPSVNATTPAPASGPSGGSGPTAQSSAGAPAGPQSGGAAGGPQPGGATSAASAAPGKPATVPQQFRNIRLGMTLDQVKSALLKDPYFDYKGPPDVSMLASPDENLIETSGYSFISRALFQFYQKKLYIMILMLNPQEISYYTMYTTLRKKYGPSTSLSPDEVVWDSPQVRLSLERPLTIKYIDMSVFNRLKKAGKMKQSERSISRDAFLNQF